MVPLDRKPRSSAPAAIERPRAQSDMSIETAQMADSLEDVARRLATFTTTPTDTAALLAKVKSESRQSSKRTAELVAEAQRQAMFGDTAKRASGGGSASASSADEHRAALPATTQWVGAGEASVSDKQLRQMIVEMTTLNKR